MNLFQGQPQVFNRPDRLSMMGLAIENSTAPDCNLPAFGSA